MTTVNWTLSEAADAAQDREPEFDFSSRYSSNLPHILELLNISIIATSYQSQRLIMLRSMEGKLDTHLKAFPRPMGVYADHDRITLGTYDQVLNFKRSDSALDSVQSGYLDGLEQLPRKLQEKDPNQAEAFRVQRSEQLNEIKQADSLYIQRASLTTGMINIHDIAWGHEGLWVVNSTFSCLATLDPEFNFIARWQPPFISELAPEDRCHLNGMAMLDGKPAYVTTFNQENSKDSWYSGDNFTGTLIDVESKQILRSGLIMPHSPRCYNGLVYYCESGRGEVQVYDPKTSKHRTLCKLPGYTRGIAFWGELMLVGTSKIRASDKTASFPLKEELGDEGSQSGIWLLNPVTGEEIAHLIFEGDVEQIYDIAVIPDSCKPDVIKAGDALIGHLFEYGQKG